MFHWVISATTLRGRVATSCFNFHPLIFHNSLLTEAPDQIMTVSRPVSCFLFGSSCGFGGGVTGIRTPPPQPINPHALHQWLLQWTGTAPSRWPQPGANSRGLGLRTGLWPRPLGRRMALGGSTGPRARGPRFVKLLSGLAQSLGVSAGCSGLPRRSLLGNRRWRRSARNKVAVSEDTQLKSVRPPTGLLHFFFTNNGGMRCLWTNGRSLRLYRLSGFWEKRSFLNNLEIEWSLCSALM